MSRPENAAIALQNTPVPRGMRIIAVPVSGTVDYNGCELIRQID